MTAIEAGCGSGGVPDSGALVSYGPTLMVQIGFDREFAPGGILSLPERRWPAMVDTGADTSCIDSELATELGLPIVDRGKVSGIHGAMGLNLHTAQIHIPELDFTLYGQFYGVHLAAGGQPQSALLGRNFLQHFTMVYNGRTGSVTINDD